MYKRLHMQTLPIVIYIHVVFVESTRSLAGMAFGHEESTNCSVNSPYGIDWIDVSKLNIYMKKIQIVSVSLPFRTISQIGHGIFRIIPLRYICLTKTKNGPNECEIHCVRCFP